MMKRQDSLLPMRIVLITGISGSGKSVALNALEDAGYYCVDNLPPHVLPELARYLAEDGQRRLAVAIDARSSASLDEMPGLIRDLSREHDVRVLFLNASTQALIQRFPRRAAAIRCPARCRTMRTSACCRRSRKRSSANATSSRRSPNSATRSTPARCARTRCGRGSSASSSRRTTT